MKSEKIECIGSFIIVGILLIMMIISLLFTILPKILVGLNLSNDKINNFFQIVESTPKIDFEKIYPFEKKEFKKNTSLINKYLNTVDYVKNKLEGNTSKGLYGYEKLIEFSYIYNNLISYKIVSNNLDSRIEVEDGNFTSIGKKKDMSYCSNELINFSNYLEELNIKNIYIQAPFKLPKDQKIPLIYHDYTNDNMDDLLNMISGKVNYIDLRENIKNNNLNHLHLFFKTDHHWLPETGLWASQEISKYLNNNYDLNLEIDNIASDKFNYNVYENIFLGSAGRFVSLANAKPENMTLITPNYYTKLNIKIPQLSLDKTGTYDDTLIDWEQLQYKNYYKIDQFSSYLYGNKQLIEIKNENVHNNKKILLLKDSFSKVVAPFLALENEYLSIIDLRNFNGSLKGYIKDYNPDLVIVMYNGSLLVDENDKNEEAYLLWDNLNK